MTINDPSSGARAGLPDRHVTMSQLVAYNMAFFRKAAEIDQQDFGQLVGWSAASVSAAERSWDGKRIKVFDADEITQIAAVLGLPVTALFLLPEDHGTAVRYVVDTLGQSERFSEVFPLRVFPHPTELEVVGRPAFAAYKDRVTSLIYNAPAQPPADKHWQAEADLALAKFAVHAAETRLADLAGHPRTQERVANEVLQTDDLLTSTRKELDSLIGRREVAERQVERVEGRLEYLRAFERNYRTKLQAFAEGQLRELYAPEMRQQAEERIRELQETTAGADAARSNALLLHQDGTYEVLPLGPGNRNDSSADEELGDRDTEA